MLPLVLIVSGLIFIRIALGNKIPRILSNSKFLGFLGISCIIFGFIGILRPDPFKDFVRSNLLIDPSQVLLLLIFLFSAYFLYDVWYEEPDFPQPITESPQSLPKHGRKIPKRFRRILRRFSWILVLGFAVIALLEPYLPSLFSRMTGIETPWFKANFNSEAIRPILEIKRQELPRSYFHFLFEIIRPTVQRDIHFLETNAYFLESKGKNATQIQQKVDDYKKFLILYDCLKKNLDKARNDWQMMGKGSDEIYTEKIRPLIPVLEEIRNTNTMYGPLTVLQYCSLSNIDLQRLIGVPFFYLYLGFFYVTVDNYDDGINTFKAGLDKEDNLSLHYWLGFVLFLMPNATKEDKDESMKHYERALQIVEENKTSIEKNYDESIKNFQSKNNSLKVQEIQNHENQHKNDLIKRFATPLNSIKNEIAYNSALEGVRELKARDYSEQVYRADSKNPNYIDTYGYVLLRFAKNREEIQKALLLFKEAEFLAKDNRDALAEIRLHKEQAKQLLIIR